MLGEKIYDALYENQNRGCQEREKRNKNKLGQSCYKLRSSCDLISKFRWRRWGSSSWVCAR